MTPCGNTLEQRSSGLKLILCGSCLSFCSSKSESIVLFELASIGRLGEPTGSGGVNCDGQTCLNIATVRGKDNSGPPGEIWEMAR